MLLRLDHVTLRSSDFDRCERFYCGILGMRVGPRPAFPMPGRWFYLGDRPVLHVLLAGHGDRATVGSTVDHFAMRATGLAGFVERSTAAGQAIDLRRQCATGEWQMFISDPDGALVELAFAASESATG